jgi:hypothetical protein
MVVLIDIGGVRVELELLAKNIVEKQFCARRGRSRARARV